ncbi:hypothetical protein MTO96_000253 [Rhipicephalus appendiculatus]
MRPARAVAIEWALSRGRADAPNLPTIALPPATGVFVGERGGRRRGRRTGEEGLWEGARPERRPERRARATSLATPLGRRVALRTRATPVLA